MPLLETEVSRSCRLQKANKGFKNAVCKDKTCLSCNAKPPIIPPKVVKNLNSAICKVNIQDTNEEKLTNRTKKPKGTQATSKMGTQVAAKEGTTTTI